MDWSRVDGVVAAIPRGRWTSYGAVAIAAGLTKKHSKAVGRYLADADVDGVWRVLDGEGRPSPHFRLHDFQSRGDRAEQIAWLKEEGVKFDEHDRARDHDKIEAWQLAAEVAKKVR